MKTLVSKAMQEGTVITVHHQSSAPTDEDARGALAVLEDVWRRFGRVHQIIFTDRPAPSAKQRKEASQSARQAGADKTFTCAIVTSSAMARGVVTAMTWLGLKGVRPFSPNQLHEALQFVKLNDAALVEVAQVANACFTEVGGPRLNSLAALPATPQP